MFWDLIDLKTLRRAVLYFLVMAAVLLLQNVFFARVRLFGAAGMFIPAFVVAAAMFEGSIWGGVFGLLAGWVCDLTFHESTILFTLLLPALGCGAGWLAGALVNRSFLPYILTAVLALAVTAGLQLLRAGITAGIGFPPSLVRMALRQVLVSLPMTVIIYFPCRVLSTLRGD